MLSRYIFPGLMASFNQSARFTSRLMSSFVLSHALLDERFVKEGMLVGSKAFFPINERGQFPVLFTGVINRHASATVSYFTRDRSARTENTGGSLPPPSSTPFGRAVGTQQPVKADIPLTFRVFTPDGREFTAAEITRADLQKYRDRRGAPLGYWSYALTSGENTLSVEQDLLINNIAEGKIRLNLLETIASESAPPLLDKVPISIISPSPSLQFDLFRIGKFTAEVSSSVLFSSWRGSMKLIDPDGVTVAQASGDKLSFDVGLRTINKSRDVNGRVRPWTLAIKSEGNSNAIINSHVSATVIGSGKITTAAFQSRVDRIFSKLGQSIKIYGENKDGEMLARLQVTDPFIAETINMHDLLDGALRRVEQDGNINPSDFETNKIYTLFRNSASLLPGASLNVDGLTLDGAEVTVGPGTMLDASIPAVKLTVKTRGALKLKVGPATLAEIKMRNGKFSMEVGMKLASDGIPQIMAEVSPRAFDIDVNSVVAATLTLSPLLGITTSTLAEYIESKLNTLFSNGVRNLFPDLSLASRILMTFFGAHLTYKPVRFQGDEIIFDHIAPVEPEPKPTPGYQGAIGRNFTQIGSSAVTFFPGQIGDTWRSNNLKKIEHIVVVMMENRSYDHVLGYRQEADGLVPEMVKEINMLDNRAFNIRAMRSADFRANALGLRTAFPKFVGHETHDVDQQLSVQATVLGRTINSPKGFVDNFRPKLTIDPNTGRDVDGVLPNDVLGYYGSEDLPFYRFLAENYAYSDRYYSSHPGPTLPNRMYSLTGDVQRDRYGFPILDNNNSDNFILSRVPTIYDLLVRNGLNFRVYESQPSITMLRMFARYATDVTNIVPIAQLKDDVAPGGRGLPAFTAIEPQMHAFPQNDDHPDADMYRGQVFLKGVYDILTSNLALWQKTLLIITYDEHGGFYDHVVPPIADIYNQPSVLASPRPTRGNVVAGAPAAVQSAPQLMTPYGVRVPTFVVSPWVSKGRGPGVTLDHCSILKTALARFFAESRPFLSDRVNASESFDAFLTEQKPRTDIPAAPTIKTLPDEPSLEKRASGTTQIDTAPLFRRRMRQNPVDYHELSGRWARQLGR